MSFVRAAVRGGNRRTVPHISGTLTTPWGTLANRAPGLTSSALLLSTASSSFLTSCFDAGAYSASARAFSDPHSLILSILIFSYIQNKFFVPPSFFSFFHLQRILRVRFVQPQKDEASSPPMRNLSAHQQTARLISTLNSFTAGTPTYRFGFQSSFRPSSSHTRRRSIDCPKHRSSSRRCIVTQD